MKRIKRFIINTVIEDYRNNGRMRRLINDGFASDLAQSKDESLPFRIRGSEI
jgi:hypothetical protein